MQSLNEAIDLASQWGDNLLRLYTLQAQDNRLREKLEEQLCLAHDALERCSPRRSSRRWQLPDRTRISWKAPT